MMDCEVCGYDCAGANPPPIFCPNRVEWRPVPGYEGNYEVSNHGGVRSIVTNHGNPRRRELKQSDDGGGYLSVCLSLNNRRKRWRVALLVLLAFVGPRPDGLQCCHSDGNRANNRLLNLRWDTPKSNDADRVAHGRLKGERHSMASITESVARQIKMEATNSQALARDIADRHGTTVHVVRNIRNGKTWGWLSI